MSLLAELHQRHKAFNMAIAERAARVVHKEQPQTYAIPNTPFGVKKIQPMKPRPRPARNIEPDYWPQMWFFDLVNHLEPQPSGPLFVHTIQQAVCRKFGFKLEHLNSQRRFAPLVRARQIGVYLSKTLTGRSLPEIGRRFGGRDHTTILHAVRRIESLMKTDNVLAADVAALRAELGAS